jgi:hypothetical protein
MSRSSGLLHSKGPSRLVAVGENRGVCTAGSLIALPSVCHCQIKRSIQSHIMRVRTTCSSSICLIDAFPRLDLGSDQAPHFSPGLFPSSEQVLTFTSYIAEGKQAPPISSSATERLESRDPPVPAGLVVAGSRSSHAPTAEMPSSVSERRVARWR